MPSTSAQQQLDNSPIQVLLKHAKVYPDTQLPSTSAATIFVTTTKKLSTRQYQKPKSIACNLPAFNLKFC